MASKVRIHFLKNRLTPTIIVFGLVMIGFGLLLYTRLDSVYRAYEQQVLSRNSDYEARLYAEDLKGEIQKLSMIAWIIENDTQFSDEQSLKVTMEFVNTNYKDDPNTFTGLLTADGSAIYGDALSPIDYRGIMTSLRGSGGISYTPSGGVLFSCPIFRGGNVRYVLYELVSASAFCERFPVSAHDGRGHAMLMTRDGDVVMPFASLDEKERSFYESRSVRIVFQQLIRHMDTKRSVASMEKTTKGDQLFYAAEVPGTNFIYAGVVERAIISGGLYAIPKLVLGIFMLLVIMVMSLSFFLLITSQRVREGEALKRAKAAAEEASRAKSDFLANMSHEIRTPINTILGMDEMLLRECTDPTQRKYAINIQRAGAALLSQINDVLDFSKIEAGKMELFPDEYDLTNLITDMVVMMSSRAVAKGLTFEVEVDEKMPHILFGDSARIRQVVINLLSNAVKYTREGGVTFAISYEKANEKQIDMKVVIKDTGIGIRKEDIDKLFSAFERIDEARNRTIEGTGLGMNIVWKLLNLMGSRPNVESVYGEGSEFSFVLRQEVINWEPIGDIRQRIEELGDNGGVYHVSFTAPEAKVLLVDDTEMNLMVVKGLLKSTQLQIDTAADGKQALSLTEKRTYDCLLIDHRMPVMDGMEMIRALRDARENANANKPCIALTANAIAGAREEYLAAGFDDYLIKPVNGQSIESMLLKYLPDSKVNHVGKVFAQAAADPSEDGAGEAAEPQSPIAARLNGFEEKGILDVREGIEYAGSEEMYMTVLQFFLNTIDAKSDEIRGYYDNEDWENYQTKVHALKSSAKVVGAQELSDRARSLELAAKDGDLDYIREHTGDVLAFFGSYKEKLKSIRDE